MVINKAYMYWFKTKYNGKSILNIPCGMKKAQCVQEDNPSSSGAKVCWRKNEQGRDSTTKLNTSFPRLVRLINLAKLPNN